MKATTTVKMHVLYETGYVGLRHKTTTCSNTSEILVSLSRNEVDRPPLPKAR